MFYTNHGTSPIQNGHISPRLKQKASAKNVAILTETNGEYKRRLYLSKVFNTFPAFSAFNPHTQRMKRLFSRTLTYTTALSEAEIEERLSMAIEPSFSNADRKPYKGDLAGKTFVIQRQTGYKNPCLPKITGIVTPTPDTTTIHVTMAIIPNLVIILGFLTLFAVIGLVITILAVMDRGIDVFTVISLACEILPCIVILVVFDYECGKSRTDLKRLFEANVTSAN